MAKHIKTGQKGEALAVEHFKKKGFIILHRNWRHRHWEVDIIAEEKGILHFIEVKTKTSNRFGYPEEEVNEKKIRNLISAAEVYLYQHPQWKKIQFDILSITLEPEIHYFFIEDVYV